MLQIGEKAPLFEVKDQAGNLVRLTDLLGKGKKIILYFYPKDDTKGCTEQACDLRDNFELLEKENFIVLGISKDDEKAHQKFIKKYDLPFTLLADTDTSINQLYGVWAEKSMYGKKYFGTERTTFVINADGMIEKIINKVKTKEHSAQILA